MAGLREFVEPGDQFKSFVTHEAFIESQPWRRWQGEDDAVQAFGTNAWLQTPDGEPIDLREVIEGNLYADVEWPGVSSCEDCCYELLPGVLMGVNGEYGIERCDTCQRYEGDLDAAMALANRLGPDVTVWYTPSTRGSSD